MQRWWLLSRLIWTLLLLTWSIYLLTSGLYLSSTLAVAFVAAEASSSITVPVMGTQDPVSVILVALLNVVMSSMRPCLESAFRHGQVITSVFITGMRESVSFYWLNLKYLKHTCYKLGSGYAMAHTKLSTKTLSEQYSDL